MFGTSARRLAVILVALLAPVVTELARGGRGGEQAGEDDLALSPSTRVGSVSPGAEERNSTADSVPPNALHSTAAAHTAINNLNQPFLLFWSRVLPINTAYTLRIRSDGSKNNNYLVEPKTSFLLDQRYPAISEKTLENGKRDALDIKSNFTFPVTGLNFTKMTQSFMINNTGASVSNTNKLLKTVFNRNTFASAPTNGYIFLHPKLNRGTVNNFERALLPKFFKPRIMEYPVIMKQNKNNDLNIFSTSLPIPFVKSENKNFNLPNVSLAKEHMLVANEERMGKIKENKPSFPKEFSIGVFNTLPASGARSYKESVSEPTVSHSRDSSNTLKEPSVTSEQEYSSEHIKVNVPDNFKAFLESRNTTENKNSSEMIGTLPSSTERVYDENKNRPLENASLTANNHTYYIIKVFNTKATDIPLEENSTLKPEIVSAWSQNVEMKVFPSTRNNDFDVGKSEKNFLFAFQNIFGSPNESLEVGSEEPKVLSRNTTEPVVANQTAVPITTARHALPIQHNILSLFPENNAEKSNYSLKDVINRKYKAGHQGENNRLPPQHLIVPSAGTLALLDSKSDTSYSSLLPTAKAESLSSSYLTESTTKLHEIGSELKFYVGKEDHEESQKTEVIPVNQQSDTWNNSFRLHTPHLNSGMDNKTDLSHTEYLDFNKRLFQEDSNNVTKENIKINNSDSRVINLLHSNNTVLMQIGGENSNNMQEEYIIKNHKGRETPYNLSLNGTIHDIESFNQNTKLNRNKRQAVKYPNKQQLKGHGNNLKQIDELVNSLVRRRVVRWETDPRLRKEQSENKSFINRGVQRNIPEHLKLNKSKPRVFKNKRVVRNKSVDTNVTVSRKVKPDRKSEEGKSDEEKCICRENEAEENESLISDRRRNEPRYDVGCSKKQVSIRRVSKKPLKSSLSSKELKKIYNKELRDSNVSTNHSFEMEENDDYDTLDYLETVSTDVPDLNDYSTLDFTLPNPENNHKLQTDSKHRVLDKPSGRSKNSFSTSARHVSKNVLAKSTNKAIAISPQEINRILGGIMTKNKLKSNSRQVLPEGILHSSTQSYKSLANETSKAFHENASNSDDSVQLTKQRNFTKHFGHNEDPYLINNSAPLRKVTKIRRTKPFKKSDKTSNTETEILSVQKTQNFEKPRSKYRKAKEGKRKNVNSKRRIKNDTTISPDTVTRGTDESDVKVPEGRKTRRKVINRKSDNTVSLNNAKIETQKKSNSVSKNVRIQAKKHAGNMDTPVTRNSDRKFSGSEDVTRKAINVSENFETLIEPRNSPGNNNLSEIIGTTTTETTISPQHFQKSSAHRSRVIPQTENKSKSAFKNARTQTKNHSGNKNSDTAITRNSEKKISESKDIIRRAKKLDDARSRSSTTTREDIGTTETPRPITSTASSRSVAVEHRRITKEEFFTRTYIPRDDLVDELVKEGEADAELLSRELEETGNEFPSDDESYHLDYTVSNPKYESDDDTNSTISLGNTDEFIEKWQIEMSKSNVPTQEKKFEPKTGTKKTSDININERKFNRKFSPREYFDSAADEFMQLRKMSTSEMTEQMNQEKINVSREDGKLPNFMNSSKTLPEKRHQNKTKEKYNFGDESEAQSLVYFVDHETGTGKWIKENEMIKETNRFSGKKNQPHSKERTSIKETEEENGRTSKISSHNEEETTEYNASSSVVNSLGKSVPKMILQEHPRNKLSSQTQVTSESPEISSTKTPDGSVNDGNKDLVSRRTSRNRGRLRFCSTSLTSKDGSGSHCVPLKDRKNTITHDSGDRRSSPTTTAPHRFQKSAARRSRVMSQTEKTTSSSQTSMTQKSTRRRNKPAYNTKENSEETKGNANQYETTDNSTEVPTSGNTDHHKSRNSTLTRVTKLKRKNWT